MIAEFMGYEVLYRPHSNGFVEISKTELCDVDDLKYHKDWNELIKVVQSAYDTDIEGNIIGDITHALVDCDRERTYEAVVEFIKFYNNLNQIK